MTKQSQRPTGATNIAGALGYNQGVLAVVDAANVVGSVPDGWWRDRVGATEQLRDALAAAGPRAVPGASDDAELVLVVEGVARSVKPVPRVRVVAATGEGDDAIVELLKREGTGHDIVVTADRALQKRVKALGARVVPPRSLRLPDYWRSRHLAVVHRRRPHMPRMRQWRRPHMPRMRQWRRPHMPRMRQWRRPHMPRMRQWRRPHMPRFRH
jgi:hypothetical protein